MSMYRRTAARSELFTEGVRADRDGFDDVGLGGTDDAASGIQGPELRRVPS